MLCMWFQKAVSVKSYGNFGLKSPISEIATQFDKNVHSAHNTAHKAFKLATAHGDKTVNPALNVVVKE